MRISVIFCDAEFLKSKVNSVPIHYAIRRFDIKYVSIEIHATSVLHHQKLRYNLDSVRLGSSRMASHRLSSPLLSSACLGSSRLGSPWLGSARVRSARPGSALLGSARLGLCRVDSARRPATLTEASPVFDGSSQATTAVVHYIGPRRLLPCNLN